MSVQPRYRGIAPATLAVVLVAVVLSLSSGLVAPGSTLSGSAIRTLVESGSLPRHDASAQLPGTVAFLDASPPPTVSLNYSFDAVKTTNLTNGVVLSSVCSAENATVVVPGEGGFDLSIEPTPAMNCTIPKGGQVGTCVSLSGPVRAGQRHPDVSTAARRPLDRDPERYRVRGPDLSVSRGRTPRPGHAVGDL